MTTFKYMIGVTLLTFVAKNLGASVDARAIGYSILTAVWIANKEWL